jgi:hypothetical protein
VTSFMNDPLSCKQINDGRDLLLLFEQKKDQRMFSLTLDLFSNCEGNVILWMYKISFRFQFDPLRNSFHIGAKMTEQTLFWRYDWNELFKNFQFSGMPTNLTVLWHFEFRLTLFFDSVKVASKSISISISISDQKRRIIIISPLLTRYRLKRWNRYTVTV